MIDRGEAACRQYLRSVLLKQRFTWQPTAATNLPPYNDYHSYLI
ncbi:hypothetical protein [Nostoc sp. LEGE 12447]|nr:hypothetical protein [Nostoc sp. LEGE 12447]